MKTTIHARKLLAILCGSIAFVFLVGLACNSAAQTQVPTAVVAMPAFPWPPPKPSAIASLDLGASTTLSTAKLTLGDIDDRIDEALVAGGYEEKSYFGIPGGFARVTRIEQINPDGLPDYSNRWIPEISGMSIKEFSLSKYFEALFTAPKGHYRIFVFMVTSNLIVQSGTPVSRDEAQDWIVEGANKLPTELRSAPYTEDHSCTVYVYEFVQPGYGEQAEQNVPSNITGKEHLERAGLWDKLEE